MSRANAHEARIPAVHKCQKILLEVAGVGVPRLETRSPKYQAGKAPAASNTRRCFVIPRYNTLGLLLPGG